MTHKHKNPRHAYYRVRAEGHNVPVLNPSKEPDQNPKAIAKITRFVSEPKQALATVDLSEAYQPHASRVLRTFTLQERKQLLVTDEISATKPSELWWFLHTEAKVALSEDKRTATLTQNGKNFIVRLEEPKDAVFSVMECKPLPSSPNPEKQASNVKRQKLTVHLNGVQAIRVQVSMESVL